jgi:hypothetical protein
MDVYAFSHKEFVREGKHTNIFKAALDAFNIFDLFYEVWKNIRWLLGACILKRPYGRQPQQHATFGLFEAMNGKRDVAYYGNRDTYAMLDLDQQVTAKDVETGSPGPLLAGDKPRESESDDPKEYRKPAEYSSLYGEAVNELQVSHKMGNM